MFEHPLPCSCQCPLLPLSHTPSDVRSEKPCYGRITHWVPSYSILRHRHGFHHTPQDDLSPRVRHSTRMSLDRPTGYIHPDSPNGTKCRISPHSHPSSESQQNMRCRPSGPRCLGSSAIIYPEAFEGLDPSKQLGENVFSGRTPHPNEVFNLFVQQNLTSALPMAYYMAIRRGPNSLMDGCLPPNATLPPKIPHHHKFARSGCGPAEITEPDETCQVG